MSSAFDKVVVLWTLCALTTLLCGLWLAGLCRLLGPLLFMAVAGHAALVVCLASFRLTAFDGTKHAAATSEVLRRRPGPLELLAYYAFVAVAVVPFWCFYAPCFVPLAFVILCLDHSPLRVRDSISKTAKATAYGHYTAWLAGVGDDHLATAFVPLRWRPVWGLVALQFRLGRRLPMPLSINVVYTGRPRTMWLDGVMREAVSGRDGVNQVVILGAGFDTRFYRLRLPAATACFEVDAPGTQGYKRACLATAGVDTSAVTYVPVDFEHQSWLEELSRCGFDRNRRALLVWEGVSMYLTPPAVHAMMTSFGQCASGSLLAFDVWRRFAPTMAGPDDAPAAEPPAKGPMERVVGVVSSFVGERLRFGIEADEEAWAAEVSRPLRAWMEGKYGFQVVEDLSSLAIDATWLSIASAAPSSTPPSFIARNTKAPRFVVVANRK